jgi:membrane protein DedA with SNARE-associated domain
MAIENLMPAFFGSDGNLIYWLILGNFYRTNRSGNAVARTFKENKIMPFGLFIYSPLDFLPYCVLGLLAFAEGPIATLLGGAASSSGLLLPVPVYLAVVMGNLTADMGWYTLGRFCKQEWLARLAPRVGISHQRIGQLESSVKKYAPRMLFLAKLTVGLPVPTLIATGLSRVPVHRWVGMLVMGELIKSAALVSVGYLYARAIQQATTGVQVILWIITTILLAGGLFWFKRHKQKSVPQITPSEKE